MSDQNSDVYVISYQMKTFLEIKDLVQKFFFILFD